MRNVGLEPSANLVEKKTGMQWADTQDENSAWPWEKKIEMVMSMVHRPGAQDSSRTKNIWDKVGAKCGPKFSAVLEGKRPEAVAHTPSLTLYIPD